MDIEYWKNVHKMNFEGSNKMPWEIGEYDINLEKSLKFINLKSGSVLELGCGVGEDSIFLSNFGFEVDGIDINENFINIAKEKNKNVNFICGDVYKDIPNKTYDLIFDRGFLHNVPYKNYYNTFKLINSVLSDKGYFVLITGQPNPNIPNTMVPNPTPYDKVVLGFKDFFDIKLIREINFKLNEDFKDSLGIIYILKKIK